MSVEITDKPVRLVAHYEGYYHLERILKLGMDSPVELRLSKFSGNRDLIQQKYRNQFYHNNLLSNNQPLHNKFDYRQNLSPMNQI